METLYRVRPEPPEGEFDTWSAGELLAAKFHTELSADDPSPKHLIHGEWYCTNQDCAVREVRINAKWPEGDRPAKPRVTCPNCGLNLKFHGFITTTTLVPAE